MIKKIGSLFLVFVMSLLVSSCLAATIYLKDGKVVKGDIVQKGKYDTIINVGSVPQRFFNDQIERIEEQGEEYKSTNEASAPLKSFADISDEKVTLILALLNVNGTRNAMEENLTQVIQNAPIERQAELKELFNVSEIINALVPIYDKYYSVDELKQLIVFYQSPLGKKVNDVTPMLMKEALNVTIKYVKSKLQIAPSK